MPSRASQSSIDRIELGDGAPLQAAVVAEQAAHGHLLVEAALLGQVADAIARGAVSRGAEHLDLPCVGQQDVHDHPQRGRLARAVGADEAVDRSLGHGEREAVDGGDAVESLGDVGEADRWSARRGTFYGFDNLVKLFTL